MRKSTEIREVATLADSKRFLRCRPAGPTLVERCRAVCQSSCFPFELWSCMSTRCMALHRRVSPMQPPCRTFASRLLWPFALLSLRNTTRTCCDCGLMHRLIMWRSGPGFWSCFDRLAAASGRSRSHQWRENMRWLAYGNKTQVTWTCTMRPYMRPRFCFWLGQ